MTVGDRTAFSPDDLLTTAVAACLMRTFLRLATEAGQPILSYAATAHTNQASDSIEAPRVIVHAYVLTEPGADTRTVAELITRSAQVSPVAQRLALRPTVTSEVRELCPSDRQVP